MEGQYLDASLQQQVDGTILSFLVMADIQHSFHRIAE